MVIKNGKCPLLKSGCHLSEKNFNESPLKMMKNSFYFILKALFVLKIFNFLFIQKNGLIRKIRLISKCMTSQLVQQTVAIHILCNISQTKSNQAVEFGKVIELKGKRGGLNLLSEYAIRITSKPHLRKNKCNQLSQFI